jgi:tRNA(Ile2)-agmatinylcytidine synthase
MGSAVPASMLAFDDTDSPEGMCTTYLATLVLEEFSDLDLVGLPRLVRLDPNIPWKTRGNAAVCLPLGHGRGQSRPCGEIHGKSLRCYANGTPAEPRELVRRTSKVLEGVARFDCEKTNPGIVATNRRPPASLYWRAVREVVPMSDVLRILKACGGVWKGYKNRRGLIGATSAISWRPRDRTWEVIAYRSQDRFGTPREIDPESVIQMDRSTKYTFNNYDYENDHIAISPGSPCPILFGIRGDDRDELLRARGLIRGEKQDRWLLFLTNQATEDHIVKKGIGSLRTGDSARVDARVVVEPRTIPGGHVILRVSDGDEIDTLFYEPSGSFRNVARALMRGDEVTLLGSVREVPRSLNVEKLMVSRLAQKRVKVNNPLCKRCRKRMGSMGSGQGYRCKKCGAKAPLSSAKFRNMARVIKPGWYEPPVASRRHLHKPIRRMSRVNINKL